MKNGTPKKPAAKPVKQLDMQAKIELCDYQLWEADGGCTGRVLHYWLQAESDLKHSGGLKKQNFNR